MSHGFCSIVLHVAKFCLCRWRRERGDDVEQALVQMGELSPVRQALEGVSTAGDSTLSALRDARESLPEDLFNADEAPVTSDPEILPAAGLGVSADLPLLPLSCALLDHATFNASGRRISHSTHSTTEPLGQCQGNCVWRCPSPNSKLQLSTFSTRAQDKGEWEASRACPPSGDRFGQGNSVIHVAFSSCNCTDHITLLLFAFGQHHALMSVQSRLAEDVRLFAYHRLAAQKESSTIKGNGGRSEERKR